MEDSGEREKKKKKKKEEDTFAPLRSRNAPLGLQTLAPRISLSHTACFT